MPILAAVAVAGSLVAVCISWIALDIGCRGEAVGECGPGWPALIVALVGLAPAVATLLVSQRQHGHPWRWLFATVLVYALWGVVFSSSVS